jgi:glutathione S-transferase
MITATPVLYHDPTSEPSRAVHWFCLAAEIPVELEYVWLTRGEHRSARLLRVNPRHQVPALAHAGLHLSEAVAIISYLAEIEGCGGSWLGGSPADRARIQLLLSWYHTTLRLKITLRYLLPHLLMPAYNGLEQAEEAVIQRSRDNFAETLAHLDDFLVGGDFLCGGCETVPDLLFAAELFALDIDPDRDRYLTPWPRIVRWLERMRRAPGYEVSHLAWNHVAPEISARLEQLPNDDFEPSWVADECEKVLGV